MNERRKGFNEGVEAAALSACSRCRSEVPLVVIGGCTYHQYDRSDYRDCNAVGIRSLKRPENGLPDTSALHASLVTKIKATRELIYKTQIAAEGGKSYGDCLVVVDGVLTEISERLEGR